ncbi:unnamed protein product [Ixodes pacificus]
MLTVTVMMVQNCHNLKIRKNNKADLPFNCWTYVSEGQHPPDAEPSAHTTRVCQVARLPGCICIVWVYARQIQTGRKCRAPASSCCHWPEDLGVNHLIFWATFSISKEADYCVKLNLFLTDQVVTGSRHQNLAILCYCVVFQCKE